ncbi:MAG: YqcI/YcgG family protein [Ahrensia sp.]
MTEVKLMKSNQVLETFNRKSWQYTVYKEFEATLLSESRSFPCIYGIAGMQSQQLRFGFSDSMEPSEVAALLSEYLPNARHYGRNTSLVIFSKPEAVVSVEDYEHRFWMLLKDTHMYDGKEWPTSIPCELDHPGWEWCFGGEPIFVVCNTPAHINRQSRRASSFMVTFQPRWVFDAILGTEAKSEKVLAAIRDRLNSFDFIDPSPALGRYGQTENREFAQYFLDDTNSEIKCPYASLTKAKTSEAA